MQQPNRTIQFLVLKITRLGKGEPLTILSHMKTSPSGSGHSCCLMEYWAAEQGSLQGACPIICGPKTELHVQNIQETFAVIADNP